SAWSVRPMTTALSAGLAACRRSTWAVATSTADTRLALIAAAVSTADHCQISLAVMLLRLASDGPARRAERSSNLTVDASLPLQVSQGRALRRAASRPGKARALSDPE